jgi:hypothetical protein
VRHLPHEAFWAFVMQIPIRAVIARSCFSLGKEKREGIRADDEPSDNSDVSYNEDRLFLPHVWIGLEIAS